VDEVQLLDVVTQGVLGAAVGHAVLGRRIGAKAMAIGFLGGIIPDLDIFLVPDSQSLDYWQYHRGITHALVFGPVLGLPLAGLSLAIQRWRNGTPTPFGLWYAFWALVLVTHPLLDLATHWGTAFLLPFTDARFGVSAIPVIDPVYTLLLLAVLGFALVKGARSGGARHLVLLGLALSTLYIGLGWGQNLKAERLARADLEAKAISADEVHAYTTIFSPWLRRLVVVTPEAHLVGFVSTLKPQPIDWIEVERQTVAEALKAELDGTTEARIYTNFANGPIHAVLVPHEGNPAGGQELRLYDMRFGFPGRALTGLWGMLAVVDADGHLVAARRFSVDREIDDGDIMALARAKLGLEQTLF
jgi:inner membrane protein